MLKSTNNIIKELLNNNLISNEEDITGGSKTNLIFDYMINKYSYLLENNEDPKLPDNGIVYKILCFLIKNYGSSFLSNPQIIEDVNFFLQDNNELKKQLEQDREKAKTKKDESIIYLTNHYFRDDVLATMINAKPNTLILFGSLPQFYGTTDGLMAAKHGVIMVNRKNRESRKASVEKGKYVLENGMNLMICPEGVWNKKPNGLMLDFWSGFYKIAKKEDGTFYPIVPMIHYIDKTCEDGKQNPIHTIIDDPIYLDGLDEKQGVEYIRTRMLTWYWLMAEKYGKSNREILLNDHENSIEAWEEELHNRLEKVAKYDYEIETSADKRNKNDELLVWEPLSNLNITRENALEVSSAQARVRTLKENDFQHRF